MATSLLQIDDHDPLVFYSPNSSWTRGGNIADFDGTSTFTATAGASATLTFTGTGISVWGTIQYLTPNTSTYVLSSYSIDGGPTTTFNATEQTGFQFQQKLFQSATLTNSTPHTIVVTAVNNASFFIDYFLVIPAGATSTSTSSSTPSSTPSSSTVSTTVSTSDSSTTASAGAQTQSTRVSLGPVVGGTLGGLALLIIAILAFFLCCKRRRDKNQMHDSQVQVSPVPFVTPASRPLPMQQYQPHEGSDRVSEHLSYSTAPTSSSGVIPSSKAAQLSIRSPRGDSLHSRTLTDTLSPPGYDE